MNSKPRSRPKSETCRYEHTFRDFDGGDGFMMCAQPATHAPLLDDAYSQHLRQTSTQEHELEDAQPSRMLLCDEHFAELLSDLAEQSDDDPYRVWIVDEPSAIVSATSALEQNDTQRGI